MKIFSFLGGALLLGPRPSQRSTNKGTIKIYEKENIFKKALRTWFIVSSGKKCYYIWEILWSQPDHVLVTGPQPHGAGLRSPGVSHCQLPRDYTGEYSEDINSARAWSYMLYRRNVKNFKKRRLGSFRWPLRKTLFFTKFLQLFIFSTTLFFVSG